MRVMQVIAPARYGGAESIALHLASALRDAGAESLVAAVLPSDDHPFADTVRRRGLELLPVVVRRRRYDQQVSALARHVRTARADVLHAHNPHANAVARCAALCARRRCVSTFHGHLGRTPRERAYEWVDVRTLCTMHAVVTVSHAGAAELARRAPGLTPRLHVVPSALDGCRPRHVAAARADLGLGDGAPVIGWVGRFSEEKGPQLFVHSIARVISTPWRAVMVGDGPLWDATRHLADQLGVADRITFAGWHADAPVLFGAFDVVAITSRREQLPTVMLEALRAALPVVSVPVGDVPRFAHDGAGVVLAAADPESLAAALTRLLADGGERATRGAAGSAYVCAHHSPVRWAAQHLALYAAHEPAQNGRAA